MGEVEGWTLFGWGDWCMCVHWSVRGWALLSTSATQTDGTERHVVLERVPLISIAASMLPPELADFGIVSH